MVKRPENFENFLKTSRLGNNEKINVMRFAGLAYAGCRLNSWCYSIKGKKLFFGFSEYPKELANIFSFGKHLDYLAVHNDQIEPFLLSDSLGLMWIAEFDRSSNDQDPSLVYVLGPVFTAGSSPIVVREKLADLDFSLKDRRKIEAILDDIPVLAEGTLTQYARMLHFALTGELAEESFTMKKAVISAEIPEKEVTYEQLRGDRTALSRVMLYESQMMNMISSGHVDEERLRSLQEAVMPADYTDGDVLMNAKYDLTAFCARAVDTAIEAGLPARAAKTIELRFIKRTVAAHKITELQGLSSLLVQHLSDEVRKVRENPNFSEPTLLVMEYISTNLTHTIDLKKLAKHVGYTEYYLSRKFHDETGMRISDYINLQRIEYAKDLLLNTKLTVTAISELLQYTSLSYFGKIFKEKTGTSPQDYRLKKGRNKNSCG